MTLSDETSIEVVMHELVREILQTSQALVERRLQDLGLISPNASQAPLTYPVLVSQNDRPIGVADTLNFKGSGVQTSWDQSAGQITIVVAVEDTFILLMFAGAVGTPLPAQLLAWTKIGFPCEVINWELTTDAGTPGSITVDVQSSTYQTYPVYASIAGGQPPNIVADVKNRGDNLQAWSRFLDRGSYVGFVSSGVSGIERILIALTLQRLVQGYQGG